MAGEDFFDVLDMGNINIPEQEVIKEEPKLPEEETKKDEEKEKEITDDTSQERVGEKEKEKSEEEEGTTQKSPANSDEVLFSELAKAFKDRGLFSSIDAEIKNEDDFVNAFKAEIKRNEFAQLNETQKEYLEALNEGIPHEIISEHQRTRAIFQDITDKDLEEDANLRKQVIIQERLLSGWTPERAERDFKRIQDLGEELEEAKVCTESLKEKEELNFKSEKERIKQEQIEGEKQAKAKLEELKQAVYKEDNFLGSLKVDDGLKMRVYETMTKPVGYTPDGKPINKLMQHRIENPVDFETKLYYIYELTNGFTNIGKFVNKATTAASKTLRNAISNSTFLKGVGNSGGNQFPDENDYSSPIVDIEL